MKILVVDDEATLVKGIKFNLVNEGYQVDCCYDGETAVDMARAGGYHLIILDLMMPKVDGLEACQQIRQFSTVPIFVAGVFYFVMNWGVAFAFARFEKKLDYYR